MTVNTVTQVEALQALIAKARVERVVLAERLAEADERLERLTVALAEAEGEHVVASEGVSEERRRRAIADLRSFSAAELAAALKVDKSQARKWIANYEAIGFVVPAGKAFGSPTWSYVKPSEPGAAAEVSRREQAKGEERHRKMLENVPLPQPVAGTGHSTGLPTSKALRDFIRDAEEHGWTYSRKGSSHGRLTKNEQAITVPITPRNEGDSLNLLRQKLRTKHGEAWV